MAYQKLNLKHGDIFTAAHLEHIENAIYDIYETGKTDDMARLALPDIIRWETNKPLYIFKHSIITAFNYKNYNIQVWMNKDEALGKDRHRYFVYTPTDAGTTILTFKLYDTNHNLLDSKDVVVEIVAPTIPSNTTTVLFIGDSLTYYNRITDEFYRIMTSSDSESTVKDTVSIYNLYKPAGRKSTNVKLIGTQKKNYKGWTGQTYHEGRSGWDWIDFITSGSPFYIGGSLNFTKYLSNNNYDTPNVIYIGLGWNDTRNIPITDDGVIDTSQVYNSAKTFLTALTSQLPNAKIRLWTQNVPGVKGGIGNHVYGATSWSDEHRLKLMQLSIAEMYKTLAKEFKNVDIVWSTAMIDSEYALQESNSDINYRIVDDEILGVDYVHPADAGFFQIADTIVSDFMHCIIGGEEIEENDVAVTPLTINTSPVGNGVMYYQDVFKYFNNTTLSNYGSKVVIVDVSNYVGKKIKIKAAHSVVNGAYYAMFTSKLPTGLESLNDLSVHNFPDTNNAVHEDITDMLEYFNISSTNQQTNSIIKTVPSGTVYLVFANQYNYCSSPEVGVVVEEA